MKLQNPFLLCIFLALAIYCHKKDPTIDSTYKSSVKEYKLTVERGAFHYDRFELTSRKIKFFPKPNAKYGQTKYNTISETELDSLSTLVFFQEIEEKGFWDLKNHYQAYSTCTSQLRVTLTVNGNEKTVICDDYGAYCHDLIKYIDEKVVEFEGNDLKRIYLPG